MATPSYSDLASMVNSSAFTDRCTQAVIKYARYILGNNASTTNQVNWARGAVLNPAGVASSLRYAISRDDAFVQADPLNFAGMLDSDLQSAVERTVNTTVLAF
jgi:hypothetical protein